MKKPKLLVGAERDESNMTFVDHLRELRRRVVLCCIVVVAMMIPAWFLYPWFISILNEPYCDALKRVNEAANCDFLVTNLLDPFSLRLKVAGYGALILSIPIISWQLWRFVAPGLYKRERRYAMAFTTSSFILFAAGAVTAYVTLTRAVDFLVRIGGEDLDIRSGPNEFVRLALFMILAFGLGFEFPVVLVSLQMIGVVGPDRLASWRRETILAVVVLAALLTPSGDPFTLMALSLPMYLFYEIAILIGRLLQRRRNAAAAT